MTPKLQVLLLSLFLLSAITSCLSYEQQIEVNRRQHVQCYLNCKHHEPNTTQQGRCEKTCVLEQRYPGYEECQQKCQQKEQILYKQMACEKSCIAKIVQQQQITQILNACQKRCQLSTQSSYQRRWCDQTCVQEHQLIEEAQKQQSEKGLGLYRQCQQLCQQVVRRVDQFWRCEESCSQRMRMREEEEGKRNVVNQLEKHDLNIPESEIHSINKHEKEITTEHNQRKQKSDAKSLGVSTPGFPATGWWLGALPKGESGRELSFQMPVRAMDFTNNQEKEAQSEPNQHQQMKGRQYISLKPIVKLVDQENKHDEPSIKMPEAKSEMDSTSHHEKEVLSEHKQPQQHDERRYIALKLIEGFADPENEAKELSLENADAGTEMDSTNHHKERGYITLELVS